MASVALASVWFNDAADPTDRLRLDDWSLELSRSDARTVDVQRTASGRVRAVVRPGAARSWALDAPWSSPAQVAWLEAHVSRVVCVRDSRGHKVFGVFDAVSSDLVRGPESLSAVSLTITEVTFSEAV